MELKFYKRGQAKTTRLSAAVIFMAVVAVGCFVLYQQLTGYMVAQAVAPSVVFVVFLALTYWFSNKHSIVDFMIAAEGEVKKVSWSSKAEIIASTTVVIVVVAVMSLVILVTDFGFSTIFREWLNIR